MKTEREMLGEIKQLKNTEKQLIENIKNIWKRIDRIRAEIKTKETQLGIIHKTNRLKSERKHKIISKIGRCEECGIANKLEIHHKKAIKDGGDNQKNNLAILCSDCHSKKHGR
jgi:5-methylcytosine-specific restriction endonuclease McrA